MKLAEEVRIKAERSVVFAALNDAQVLRECIPGCKSLDKRSDTSMTAAVQLRLGPLNTSFEGQVDLEDIVPPESYTIVGSGTGGAAGMASGSARVSLAEAQGETVLRYEVEAKVAGKIAQLGSRLVDSAARKLSAQFFNKFKQIVEKDSGMPDAAEKPQKPAGIGKLAFRIGLAVGFVVGLVLGSALALIIW